MTEAPNAEMGYLTLTTPILGTVSHHYRLIGLVHIVDSLTEFEVSSFSRSRHMSVRAKFYSASRDPDHAPFRDDLSPAVQDHLSWSTYV